jgi:hypothetical protein
MPALQAWRFTAADAHRIRHPMLGVGGAETAPVFRETHELMKKWIPHMEVVEIPQATRGLQGRKPRPVAEGLARLMITVSYLHTVPTK